MAAHLLPYSIVSLLTLSGFNYTAHYQHPSRGDKPYILFNHGFPSSAYDWRHQVDCFANEGYGIIAPDTLGYGGTSKPLNPANYTLETISDSIIEVVNKVAGSDTKVHGVGHDWGTAILSRLANFHGDRFLSYSFLQGSYSAPGAFDVNAINEETKALLGYSTLGYWDFFNQSDAGSVIDHHQDSFVDLLYPANMSTWKTHLGPINSTRPWLEANTLGPRAAYITKEEFKIHDEIFAPDKGGYAPPLGYYTATIRGYNLPDEKKIQAPDNTTTLPTLYVGPTEDPITLIPTNQQATSAFAPHAVFKNVTAGHWLQLEQAQVVNEILKCFFEDSLKGGK